MEQRASARRAALRAAFPATVPVLTGFLCLGVAYGVLMETKGTAHLVGPHERHCLRGSMQFVAITLLTAAFDPSPGLCCR